MLLSTLPTPGWVRRGAPQFGGAPQRQGLAQPREVAGDDTRETDTASEPRGPAGVIRPVEQLVLAGGHRRVLVDDQLETDS